MKKSLCILLTVLLSLSILSGCSGKNKEKENEKEVYEDMKSSYEKAQLMSSNIGIFSRIVQGDSISYGEGGSGVIFRKQDGYYYALTCAHVVSIADASILVFTVNTEMKTVKIPGIDNLNVLDESVYDAMLKAETVFVSTRDDLAIIRFASDEDLAVIELAQDDPLKDDRIMCIGNPQNNWFAISYGRITSGVEKFGEAQKFPSNAMKHSAYINVGSSGGAAVNEKMQLAGITPGASISPDGKPFYYGVMIPVSEIRLCLGDWNG